MGTEDFNTLPFEKRLSTLTNSQESINSCCHWCLENRSQHKKIVGAWLSVLKRVKVEHRLTLFYLANDVIQYSKRKNYEFVESWGTALQKATTMVRDEKVKHKILRIFKIWEQRGIYGEEFITDLSGLISVSPSNKKGDESHEFQPLSLINKIRTCSRFETDTDYKLKVFKEHNPKLLNSEVLCSSLKDRAAIDDVEKEMDDYVEHMEGYVNALKIEIKSRNSLICLLLQAETQLEKDRKDVKVVTVAYKSFASRVKNLKRKLDEKKLTLHSPLPSPDINAPSPSPDSDSDIPEDSTKNQDTFLDSCTFTNAGFYNPVAAATPTPNENFSNNGFTSFLGSNMPFNMQNLNASSIFGNNSDSLDGSNQTHAADNSFANQSISSLFSSIIQPPPPPSVPTPVIAPITSSDYQYENSPLAPPPLPPFDKVEMYGSDNAYEYGSQNNYANGSYNLDNSLTPTPYVPENTAYNPSLPSFNQSITSFQSNLSNFVPSVSQSDGYAAYDPFNTDDYNPEEEPETWENEAQWDQPPNIVDTPDSPPLFEKESSFAPIEYHDGQNIAGAVDVDHRIINAKKNNSEKKQDIDHRNLISLTGSPKDDSNSNLVWNSEGDKDYRESNPKKLGGDHDYRMAFNIDSNPPPPPPQTPTPSKFKKGHKTQSPARKFQDNVESIDMELSDDENALEHAADLLPPPPFPDDADANNFLDSLNEDLNAGGFEIDSNEDNSNEFNAKGRGWTNSPGMLQKQDSFVMSREGPPILSRDASPMILRDGPGMMQRDGPNMMQRDGPNMMQRDGPPMMHDGPPMMHDGPPMIHDGPPMIHDGPPMMHDGPPMMHDGPPMMHDGPPMMHDGPPMMHGDGPHMMHGDGPPMMLRDGPPMMMMREGHPMMQRDGPPMMQRDGPPMMHRDGPPMMQCDGSPMMPRNGPPMIIREGPPMSMGLLGDAPTNFMQKMAMGEWIDERPPFDEPEFEGPDFDDGPGYDGPPFDGPESGYDTGPGRNWPSQDSGFRGRGNMRDDMHFRGNRGEFSDRGFRGRARGGFRGNFWEKRPGRGSPRGRPRGRGRFNGRGNNFRGGF